MIKKSLFFVFIFMLLATTLILSQERVAKIFFVNLFNEKVDVRLGEDNNPVFYMNGLDPYSATYMLKTTKVGQYKLYFKKSSESAFYFWADDGKTPNTCYVESGRSYCILIGSDGGIEYYFLEEDLKNGAKVCFLNGSDTKLSKMEIGKDWNTNTAAFTNNLDIYVITNFVTIQPSNYSLFWQFPEQKQKDTWFFYPDKTGKSKEIFNFKNGNYYLFLAYTEGRADYAKLIEITPQK